MRIKANNINSWAEIWQLPVPPSQNQYKDTVLCPVILQSPIVAVNFASQEAKEYEWQILGYVNQQIQTGIQIPNSRAVTSGGSKVFFNKLQIISFPFGGEYALEFSINSWVRQGGNLQLWEYVGEISPASLVPSENELILQTQMQELAAIMDSLAQDLTP